MDPSRFHFRGFPEFLDASARQAGRPDLAGPASRIEALAALSVLCSQAVEAPAAEAAAILQRGADFRDQIRIAFDAAHAMLLTVAQARGVTLAPVPADSSETVGAGSAKRSRPRRRSPSPDPTTSEDS